MILTFGFIHIQWYPIIEAPALSANDPPIFEDDLIRFKVFEQISLYKYWADKGMNETAKGVISYTDHFRLEPLFCKLSSLKQNTF